MNQTTKTAWITGGSQGIGLGIARCLLDDGMNVVISGRRQSVLEEAQELLHTHRDRLRIICADVRDFEAQLQVVSFCLNEFERLDVVVANAGVGHFAPVESMTTQQWHDTMDINLTGVFYTLKASLEALKASRGYFITIASLAGTNFFATGAAYNASKFGLVGFTQAVMMDLRQYGIKVTTIMPGSVSTHFNNRTPTADQTWKIQPEDIGQIVSDLLHLPARTLPSKIEVRPTTPP